MWTGILLGVFVFLTCLEHVNGQACVGATTGYNGGTESKGDSDQPIGNAVLVLDADSTVDCCGVISTFIFEPDCTTGADVTFNIQVYRPVVGMALSYELVGQQPVTVAVAALGTAITVNTNIGVMPGDVLGWDMACISFKATGNERDDYYYYTTPAAAVGGTVDVAALTSGTDHSFRMMFTTAASSAPAITDATTTITNVGAPAVIHTLVAIDADGDPFNVSLTAGNNGDYVFDETTWEISTISRPYITGTHTLTFTATDSCGNTDTGTVTITVTNPPPVFTGPFSRYISENLILETYLQLVNVSDPFDTALACDVVPGAGPWLFRLNGTDRSIRNQGNPNFNYETQNEYDITVRCTDDDNTVDQVYTFYIQENQAPFCINIQNTTNINMNHSTGALVFQGQAGDNEGDNIEFVMTCDAVIQGLCGGGCCFEVVDDGNVYLTQSLIGTSRPGYDLYITIRDDWGESLNCTLTVNILDLNSPVTITIGDFTITINENNLANFNIFDIPFFDADYPGQTLNWLSSVTPTSSLFEILGNGSLILLDSVNFETLTSTTFAIDITVQDPTTSDTVTITVEILDVNEPPSFPNPAYGLSAVESTGNAAGSLGTPNWNVQDEDTTDSEYYEMDCAPYAQYFSINSATGEVTLQQAWDMDGTGLPTDVTCSVNVTDKGGLTDTTSLYISFTEVNDNTPVCLPNTYQFFEDYYTATSGKVIGAVTVSDDDSGVFGTTYLSIDQASIGANQFAIDTNNDLRWAIAASSGSSGVTYASSYQILIIATDTGGLQGTCTIDIFVGDTTTIAPTTTTYRYKHFWEWGANLVWFVLLMLLLLAIAIISAWLCCTCHGALGCPAFFQRWRGRRGPRPYRRPQRPPPVESGTVRRPPPPGHKWQNETFVPEPPPQLRVAMVKVPRTTIPGFGPPAGAQLPPGVPSGGTFGAPPGY